MDLNSVYGGLSAEQWRTVQSTVIEEAERTRLASSFLPNVGPLDPTVEHVPPLDLNAAAAPPVPGAPARRLWVNANPTKVSHVDPIEIGDVRQYAVEADARDE